MKEKFMEKYAKELSAIFNKYEMDKGVCVDILVAYARNIDKTDRKYTYDFDGCKEINIEELKKDIKELEDNFIIPKI